MVLHRLQCASLDHAFHPRQPMLDSGQTSASSEADATVDEYDPDGSEADATCRLLER